MRLWVCWVVIHPKHTVEAAGVVEVAGAVGHGQCLSTLVFVQLETFGPLQVAFATLQWSCWAVIHPKQAADEHLLRHLDRSQ
jgi:hypothetical protein